MTKGDIVDRVQELVQDKSGAMRNLVLAWVDIVLDDIASRGLLKSLEREETAALVAGQREYALPDDTDKVRLVEVPAWGEPQGRLVKLSDEDFRRMIRSDGTTYSTRPKWYTIFARTTLRLHPIPDADNTPNTPTDAQKLHVVKFKDIAHLAEDDDLTEIRPKHTPTLIYGAYSMGARFDTLGDVVDATAKYEAGIARIVGDQTLDLDRPYRSKYQDV